MKHNFGWLNLRGLDTSGNAAALRDRVWSLLDSPAGPPPPLAPTGGTVEEALELVKSLSSMMSQLMYRTITSSLLLEVQMSIKIFLSRFSREDRLCAQAHDPGLVSQALPAVPCPFPCPARCARSASETKAMSGPPIRHLIVIKGFAPCCHYLPQALLPIRSTGPIWA